MDLDHPRWGVVGTVCTIVTAIAGSIITIISISDPQTRRMGIIVVLILIVAIAIIFWRLRTIKRIVYQIISNATVVSVDEEVKSNVKVLIRGKPVEDARIVVLKIRNVGASIPSSDYESPFTLSLGEHAEILDVAVLETFPEDIMDKVSIQVSSNKVIIDPLLLNSKDTIILKIMTSKSRGEVKLEVRVKGLNKPSSIDEINNRRLSKLRRVNIITAIIFFSSLAIFLMSGFISFLFLRGNPAEMPFLYVILVSLVLTFICMPVLVVTLVPIYYLELVDANKYFPSKKHKA